MKIRNILYGYKYVNGEIVTDDKAKQTVTEICNAYIAGDSLLTIAERLNRQGVEYRDGVTGWNKARIKRIIEDERYLGNNGYPRIISDTAHTGIEKIRNAKNEKYFANAPQSIQLEVPIRCPICHGELHRKYECRRKNSVRWRCRNEQCRVYIVKADAELKRELTAILNKLIENPDIINDSAKTNVQSDEKSQVLYDEIERLFGEITLDREQLQHKLLELASASYTELSQIHSRTKRLKDIFMQASQSEEFPEELLRRTADEIVLHKDGSAEVILINKQGVKV